MGYKDILVHVNSSKHCAARIDAAIVLARHFEAHLIGLYTAQELYFPAFITAQLSPDLLMSQQALSRELRDRARALFEERTRGTELNIEWREANGEPANMAALHARYADLSVIGQNDPDEALSDSDYDLAEAVVLHSGRPALLIPYAGNFAKIGTHVLVAWNASPPATRAVNDAVPLLRRAKKVTVLAVNPDGGASGHGDVPGADIALHLARHGVKAEADHVHADDIAVGEMILSRAADLGVDLIVMGAYGHARLRETVLGGATKTLLEHMTAPVFMSH